MKNIALHYIMLLLPLLVILFSYKYYTYSAIIFFVLLFVWIFVYHPYLTGRRLYKKGIKPTIKLKFFLYLSPKEFVEAYFKP